MQTNFSTTLCEISTTYDFRTLLSRNFDLRLSSFVLATFRHNFDTISESFESPQNEIKKVEENLISRLLAKFRTVQLEQSPENPKVAILTCNYKVDKGWSHTIFSPFKSNRLTDPKRGQNLVYCDSSLNTSKIY